MKKQFLNNHRTIKYQDLINCISTPLDLSHLEFEFGVAVGQMKIPDFFLKID
jgi:hypothetical protein